MPIGIYQRKPFSQTHRDNMSKAKKGKIPKNIYLIVGWNKDKKLPTGNNANAWKGDSAGYFAKHLWVREYKGIPLYCEHCGAIGKKHKRQWNIQWANIDHSYERNLDDYIALCRSCHGKYDKVNGLRKHKLLQQ